MIDWFAARIGILIFAIAAAGVMLVFVSFQSQFFVSQQNVLTASTLARAADILPEMAYLNYTLPPNSKLEMKDGVISIEKLERSFLSKAEDAGPLSGSIHLYRENGKIKVKKIA